MTKEETEPSNGRGPATQQLGGWWLVYSLYQYQDLEHFLPVLYK